ncbi:MAG: hypothetical protein R3D33_04505 [Hyphomicrobiaceae bacterium]
MFKLAAVIWIMLGTVLAGIALTVVLLVPTLASDSMRLIPLLAVACAVVAMPISVMIARRIDTRMRS